MKVRISPETPEARVRSIAPRSRISSAQPANITTTTATFGGAGYLIGMLGLTYTKQQTSSSTQSGFIDTLRPRASIRVT